jgi:CRP/FNR family transcriptional regulator, cyclic AMP receptor protein
MAIGALPVAEPRSALASRRPRTIALLDVDPDLGAHMTPDRIVRAAHEVRTTALKLRRGAWPAAEAGSASHPSVGLLLLSGVLAREVVLEDTVSTELLGPGDLIYPWSGEDEPHLLQQHVRWQVLADASLAVLGRSFAHALVRYPEINQVLTERALARAQRLATTQAISHLNSVERRVRALLWHFAERWGRVTADGVVVPLALSHRLLAEMVGARRPTVTTALAALERKGTIRRREDATWLLVGEPPGTPAEQVRRVVSHRRRLLSQAPPTLTVLDGDGA